MVYPPKATLNEYAITAAFELESRIRVSDQVIELLTAGMRVSNCVRLVLRAQIDGPIIEGLVANMRDSACVRFKACMRNRRPE